MNVILKRFLLILLIAGFTGSGGYLLYDQLSAQKEQSDVNRLIALASLSATHGETTAWEGQTLGGGDAAARVTVEMLAENGITPLTVRSESGGDWNVDAAAVQISNDRASYGNAEPVPLAELAAFVQSRITEAYSGSNPAIGRLSLSILETRTGERPSVQARVTGGFIAEPVTSTLEKDVADWFQSNGWHVAQKWDVEFSVRIEKPILPQYRALHDQNPDFAGWIQIEDTKINYPVMQSKDDPEFYLHANFEREYAYSGLPFLDARNDFGGECQNMIVYAHNMKNGTMFGQLPKYESRSFWLDHPIVKLDLLTERHEYEVFGAFRSRQYNEGEAGFRYYDYIKLEDPVLFDEFVRQAKQASYYDTGITPEWGDQLLTLSTCSYHTDRGSFVLVCRRVDSFVEE